MRKYVKTEEKKTLYAHILYVVCRAHSLCALVFFILLFFLKKSKQEKKVHRLKLIKIYSSGFYMNSLWPSANVVNATILWSWTIVLFVFFFLFFFVSLTLLLSRMLFYCRICWLHYVMNNRHILWLSHKIASASDLVLVTLFFALSISFWLVVLCCVVCVFSGEM